MLVTRKLQLDGFEENSMKRLFMVRTRKNGPNITEGGKNLYFESKVEAKLERNARRAQGNPDAVVSYGPDHRLYKGA